MPQITQHELQDIQGWIGKQYAQKEDTLYVLRMLDSTHKEQAMPTRACAPLVPEQEQHQEVSLMAEF